MRAGAHVRLVKRAVAREGVFPISYWAAGVLAEDLVPGRPIHLLRYARAARVEGEDPVLGVTQAGVFTSSPILSIRPPARGDTTYTVLVQTENSTWEVVPLGAIPKEAELLVGSLTFGVGGGAVVSAEPSFPSS